VRVSDEGGIIGQPPLPRQPLRGEPVRHDLVAVARVPVAASHVDPPLIRRGQMSLTASQDATQLKRRGFKVRVEDVAGDICRGPAS
jgi:hypothetical protein